MNRENIDARTRMLVKERIFDPVLTVCDELRDETQYVAIHGVVQLSVVAVSNLEGFRDGTDAFFCVCDWAR